MMQTTFDAYIKQENGRLFPEAAESIDEICKKAGMGADTYVNIHIQGERGQDSALFHGYVFYMLPHTGRDELEIGYIPSLDERLGSYGYVKEDHVTVTISQKLYP